jgi:hypothetical protein
VPPATEDYVVAGLSLCSQYVKVGFLAQEGDKHCDVWGEVFREAYFARAQAILSSALRSASSSFLAGTNVRSGLDMHTHRQLLTRMCANSYRSS